jgi:hypothetical protein
VRSRPSIRHTTQCPLQHDHPDDCRDVTRRALAAPSALDADLDRVLEDRDVSRFLRLRDEANGRVLSAACAYVARMLANAWRLHVPHLHRFI